jgi:hypothetical protein
MRGDGTQVDAPTDMTSWRAWSALAIVGYVCVVGLGSPGLKAQSFRPSERMPATAIHATFLPPTLPSGIVEQPLQEPQKPTRGFLAALGHNLVDDLEHMPRWNSVYWLAGGGAAALAVHPFDDEVNQHLQGSDAAAAFFAPGKYIGSTYVQIGASLTTYIVGRKRHQPRAQHIGMDMFEAQLLTEGIVELIKVSVRRERPTNPDGSQYPGFSFPSGHSAVTFATATVFQQHFGWKAAVPTYALATYVAASRLHDNRHFLSDVVFGASVGIVVGRSVTWHGRNAYTIAPAPMPGGLGVLVTW